MIGRTANCQIYRNALMRLQELTSGTEWQNTEERLKFLKHQWKSMRLLTNRSPTEMDSTTITTTTKTMPRAPKATATKENLPTTMAPKFSVSSVSDQGRSSKYKSC